MSLFQKYRPHQFRDVVGQEDICHILKNQIRRKRLGNAYLFAGPSGVGKTSLARIISLSLNCEVPRAGEPCLKCRACHSNLNGNAWDTVEYDAATFRGIDGIRDLTSLAKYAPFGNCKIYLLDEVHAFSEPAFNALLRFLEDSPKHLTVIMCTTEPSKVPETVKSRCQTFQFEALKDRAIIARLGTICHKERLEFGEGTLRFIATMASGNLRTALNSLEQISNLNGGKPSLKQVRRFLQPKLI